MSRHRGTIAAATLVLVLSSVPGVRDRGGGRRRLRPRDFDQPGSDPRRQRRRRGVHGPVDRPGREGLPDDGRPGMPSSWDSWVQFDFYVNGVPRSDYVLVRSRQTEASTRSGSIRSRSAAAFHSGQIDAVGAVGEVRATWLGEGEPCTDSVMLTHLGPVPFFTDIATSRFIPEIVSLAEAGVIIGCSPTRYCPEPSITREQTAAFMARALELPADGRGLLR